MNDNPQLSQLNAGFNFKEINMVNDSNFEKSILEKIDNKENLTDDELRELVKKFFLQRAY